MELKLENGGYVLGENGELTEISGRAELLQNAALRLRMKRGSFPYDRKRGSLLHSLSGQEEHAADLALVFANEALLDMPGVHALAAELTEDGGWKLRLETPLGEEEIELGKL